MITSADNARVKLARALHRPKGRREHGLYLLEGPHVVETALAAGARFNDVFVTAAFAETPLGKQLLRQLQDGGTPVTWVKEHVMGRLSGTKTPQGIAAIGPLRSIDPRAVVGGTAWLVADGISDPGNLGTMVRSAAAVNAAVWVTEGSTDLYDPKALRASAGTLFLIPHGQGLTHNDIIAAVARRGWALVAADAGGALRYDQYDWREPFALIIGNESRGVNDRLLEAADVVVRVPLASGVESLNAATTAAICLFEAHRQRNFAVG